MDNDEKINLLDKKLKLEYDKLIADMEHDLSQRYHWEQQQKSMNLQCWIWIFTVLLGFSAISANVFLRII